VNYSAAGIFLTQSQSFCCWDFLHSKATVNPTTLQKFTPLEGPTSLLKLEVRIATPLLRLLPFKVDAANLSMGDTPTQVLIEVTAQLMGFHRLESDCESDFAASHSEVQITTLLLGFFPLGVNASNLRWMISPLHFFSNL